MTEYLIANAQKGTKSTINGLRVVAVNVLGQAGYGQSKAWTTDLKHSSSQDNKLTYFEAVAVIIDNILPAAMMPIRMMRWSFMPKILHKLALALEEAPVRAMEMLEEERINLKASAEAKSNMMSMLVRLGEQENEREKDSTTTSSGQHLTEDEIRGNLFIFSAAGFDTTANTMAFAVAMLAVNPQLQDWLIEELDEVVGKLDNQDEPDYNEVFPQLKRCLAIMVCKWPKQSRTP
jgi:cytochrome P450